MKCEVEALLNAKKAISDGDRLGLRVDVCIYPKTTQQVLLIAFRCVALLPW